MKLICACLLLCPATALLQAQSNPLAPAVNHDPTTPQQAKIQSTYAHLPLSFEPNQGQTSGQVKFLSRTGAYTLYLTNHEAILALTEKKPGESSGPAPQGRSILAQPFSAGKSVAYHPSPVGTTQFSQRSGSPPSNHGTLLTKELSTPTLHVKLSHANPAPKITGAHQLPGTTNYFLGNDPKKWTTNIPTYAQVKYESIYPGIDLIYYGNQRQLEYDFIVAPQANPNQISFTITGAKKIIQTAQGNLLLKLNDSNQNEELSWHKPTAYQKKNGARQEIPSTYRITNHNQITFQLAKYDTNQPLYIDPLIYSTYLGGSGGDSGNGIAIDTAGNAYIIGTTDSTDFPVTPGAFQTACECGDGGNAFIVKINSTGSALIFSTYLGGGGGDLGSGVAVDSAGNAYVTGITLSTNFPTTPGAFQTTSGGGEHAFVSELNASGSALVYSTYLRGSGTDQGLGISVDGAGEGYVTGTTYSTDFPVTPGAFQTALGGGGGDQPDAFVTKFNSTGSGLVYSTYLGGSGTDYGAGIALDGPGNAYVTGLTSSTNFPVTSGAFQTTYGGSSGNGIAFVTKFNPTGSTLGYSTYLGGTGPDYGTGIVLDSTDDVYVVGTTNSANFPITPGAFQATYAGDGDAFVTEFNPVGSGLVYSTYLGGSNFDDGYGIALDSEGNAYVTGVTRSTDFPITPGAFQRICGGGKGRCNKSGDAFVAKLTATGSALYYSTYLGGSHGVNSGFGIAVGSVSKAYVTGVTTAADFPITSGAFQTVLNGSADAFIAHIQTLALPTTTLTSSPNPSTYGQAVTFTATVTSAPGPPPDGETISFMKGKMILGTGSLTSGTATFTTSTLKVGTTSVIATYPGDSNFAPSKSKPLKQVVNPAAN